MTFASIPSFLGWTTGENTPANPTISGTALKAAIRLAFFVLFIVSIAITANAATFTVTTLADHAPNACDAECTLRDAVTAANANSGADIIVFQVGLTGTITLDSAAGGQLLITESLAINGPGSRILSVSGGGTSRVFQINPILLSPPTVTDISGLTITGGSGAVNSIAGVPVTPGPGGGIFNTGGATLNLTEVNITGNNVPLIGTVPSNLLVGGGVATIGTDLTPTVTNITRSIIANNSAAAGGGGVSNTGTGVNLLGAVTTITNTTITTNVTGAAGGGALNTAGELNLTNDTISDNASTLVGGGVVSVIGVAPSILGVTNLRNTIIARNNAKVVGIVLNASDDVLGVLGSFNSLGNNLIGSNLNVTAIFQASVFVGGIPQPNANLDLVGSVSINTTVIDPKLGPVTNNGGPTNTRALLTGSPAIDKANNCVVTNTCATNPDSLNPPAALTTDQRSTGFTRLFGPAVDIGAYEVQGGAPSDLVLTVNTTSDHTPNGCTAGDCTLREAILDTNANPGADTIVFAPALTGSTIILASGTGFGQLLITDNLTIAGPNGCARNITISGNGTSRVFQINPVDPTLSKVVNITGVTITGGNGAENTALGLPVVPGPGGGILNTGGATLNLSEVNLSGNNIPLIIGLPTSLVGGGIATVGTDTVSTTTNISRSLISNNSAVGGGGGVSNAGTQLNLLGGLTTITNTTITNNGTVAAGGGILNTLGTLNLTNDTITDNTSLVTGGGVVNVVGLPPVGVVNLRNTIIARNNATIVGGLLTLSDDVLGIFNSLGNNLIGNNANAEVSFVASVFVGTTPQPNAKLDLVGSVSAGTTVIDPKLGPLQNNGGCTDTRATLTGSPAIDGGNNCVNLGTCSTFNPIEPILLNDQRGDGFSRSVDGNGDTVPVVDIGAYEFQGIPTAAEGSISGKVTDSNGKPIAKTEVVLTDSNGTTLVTTTKGSGQYRFGKLDIGKGYVLSANHKKYKFDPIFVFLKGDAANQDIVAEDQPRK